MVNKFGGKKHKKSKKTEKKIEYIEPSLYPEEDLMIGKVLSTLGGGYISIINTDGVERKANKNRNPFNKMKFNKGDIICTQQNVLGKKELCLVVYKYDDKEIKDLEKRELLDFTKKQNKNSDIREINNDIIDIEFI